MGWERGRYYTRSVRRGGKVIREYFGVGDVAVLIAKLDTLERRQRVAARQAQQQIRMQLKALDSVVAEVWNGIEIVARAALVAAGYRQHQRGEWRRKRRA
jgi:hypothetical protein